MRFTATALAVTDAVITPLHQGRLYPHPSYYDLHGSKELAVISGFVALVDTLEDRDQDEDQEPVLAPKPWL